MKNNLSIAINAALDAGNEILKVYETDFAVETKDDKSPLTLADKNAHLTIVSYLSTTPFPILSEEGKHDSYDQRAVWDTLWIVDPLDGTKEFVKRNGEFTVNIALVKKGSPTMGVIYVPVANTLYYGMDGIGAYKVENITPNERIETLDDLSGRSIKIPIIRKDKTYTVVGSRSHMSAETEDYFNKLKAEHGAIDVISRGSSLKLCMVAEGLADEYPRYAPTMEWDTAAGHAIAKAAGFKVYQYQQETELEYNKPDLLNPWFLVK